EPQGPGVNRGCHPVFAEDLRVALLVSAGAEVASAEGIRGSLNLSQFVEGRRWCPQAREGIEETRVVAGNELYNNVEIHRTCPRFYALQSGRLREARLLSPPRLRTGRESFPSSSSSISKAVR